MARDISVVHVWWYALSAVAVINVIAWTLSSTAYLKRRVDSPQRYSARWPHVLLSAVYVLGCAFRSFLPRADVQRIVLVDSWLSSVLVGRSVATLAELCFAAQWALILRELSRDHRYATGELLSRLVFPLICVAELFSWYAVLSTSYLGNTLEQSIWTGTVAIIAIAIFPLWRGTRGAERTFLGTALLGSIAFVCFMCTVDVPMYLTRWLADEASGRTYLTLREGLHDLATRWVVTHDLALWREELAWMALYFSLAVWFSIALVHAPRAGVRSAPTMTRVGRRSAPELVASAE